RTDRAVGLATAVGRLKNSTAKSKVVILLTDGADNGGKISPMKGAELAKDFGVRVYTIGVGTNGMAPMPSLNKTTNKWEVKMEPVVIDEQALQDISSATNGKYYRAQNTDELNSIYDAIDKLEKSKVSISNFAHRKELFMPFACVALGALLLSLILSTTVLRRNP
ncbi:MAG: VWA domain-containing protein, partial [Paludibacteraceae bacterium]|nr:VWA domain-containing protein [Paludibacteraceae bacterium]